MRTILLAGSSASGKTTLAKGLCYLDRRTWLSTSEHLRRTSGVKERLALFQAGERLDRDNPTWLLQSAAASHCPAVVDAIRSERQDDQFPAGCVRINVTADDIIIRKRRRGEPTELVSSFIFRQPDYTWNSTRVPLSQALASINLLAGRGSVDAIIGGQYGSEGKGKLAALLAGKYDVLVRSGGPNAGHWVRDKEYEYCFHHLPSGSMANRNAKILMAPGATIYPPKFWEEVKDVGAYDRLQVDRNAILIEEEDRDRETKLVDMVGSTAQGVGFASSRRILRGLDMAVRTAADDNNFRVYSRDTSASILRSVLGGGKVLIEGTQGSALSLFHGEYPFVTSRDTNVAGLLSECGVAPCHLGNVWMVVRSMPIRVGGNSGPLPDEVSWDDVAARLGKNPEALKKSELTSTTKRQRRVGQFGLAQFAQAIALNRPTRIFLSFADYIDLSASRQTEWGKLPDAVLGLVEKLEHEASCPVVGISTGRTQAEVCWRGGYAD